MTAALRSLQVGEEIPAIVRQTGFDNWNRYAAVNEEFVPIHMDDEAGQAAGYATAFGMGNLQWSYLHNVVREWIGERGEDRAAELSVPRAEPQGPDGDGTGTGHRGASRDQNGPRSISRYGPRIRREAPRTRHRHRVVSDLRGTGR